MILQSFRKKLIIFKKYLFPCFKKLISLANRFFFCTFVALNFLLGGARGVCFCKWTVARRAEIIPIDLMQLMLP